MMNKEISSALEDWKFIRQNSVEFIKSLGDNNLKEKLPRSGLNTFCKHFQEMISVQEEYILAVETGKMSFNNMGDNDSFDGQDNAEELISKMNKLDKKLTEALSSFDSETLIDWSVTEEEPKLISSHISNLSIHETLHLGQLIAFCYVLNIKIPDFIMEMWALSPQK